MTASKIAETSSQIVENAHQISKTAGQIAKTAGQIDETASQIDETAGQIGGEIRFLKIQEKTYTIFLKPDRYNVISAVSGHIDHL